MKAEFSAEIRRDVERAARAWEELEAAGQEVHFEPVGAGRAPAVTLRDRRGRVLRELTPFEVLQVAAGVPVTLAD